MEPRSYELPLLSRHPDLVRFSAAVGEVGIEEPGVIDFDHAVGRPMFPGEIPPIGYGTVHLHDLIIF